MFIKNKIYIRASIHDKYGGNRQRGISNCVKHPYIFIFTKPKNEQDFYIDKWKKNAFTDRIPDSIWFNGNPHTEPVEGDRGIRYEKIT